ncbi:MAG: four helix bundle protein [Treponema sp.]|nr:four helix bundle protein [Treponema sp.]
MTKESVLPVKSKSFAIKIIRLYTELQNEKKEFVLSKQILRSGTSIGANIREAIRGQSKADFYAKLYISLKEAEETEYWLELFSDTDFITYEKFDELSKDCEEIIRILMATVKHKDEN